MNDYKKRLKNQCLFNSLIKHIENYANGSTIFIGQVSQKWIEGFQESLLENELPNGKKLSPASVATYMKFLRAVFRKALADGTINRDPTANVAHIKNVDSDMVFLSTDEVKRLVAFVPESDYEREIRRAFLFACFTGLRVSDIETLSWGMIEMNPPQIIKRQQKTQNPVYIPLGKNAQNIIFDEKTHDSEKLVFTITQHSRTASNIALKRWANEAGITKKIGWHTARRTFATLTLGSGADAITVARLLGHTGLGQVMKYAKATDEMKRRAVDALPDLI